MERELLVVQALAAKQAAKHNLKMIVREPERMIHPQKLNDGIQYLKLMINFGESETENAHRPGWASIKTRLLKHLSFILIAFRRKSKGGVL